MNNQRSNALAERLEKGALALATFASSLDERQWGIRLPGDGRKVGVVVHHVASMYPVEMSLAQLMADGKPIAGVTWPDVHAINAKHAKDFDGVSREAAVELVVANSAAAAAALRQFTDAQLDFAAPISLNANAPLTLQFFLEDHPVRHSYHHLAGIHAAVIASSDAKVRVA